MVEKYLLGWVIDLDLELEVGGDGVKKSILTLIVDLCCPFPLVKRNYLLKKEEALLVSVTE